MLAFTLHFPLILNKIRVSEDFNLLTIVSGGIFSQCYLNMVSTKRPTCVSSVTLF